MRNKLSSMATTDVTLSSNIALPPGTPPEILLLPLLLLLQSESLQLLIVDSFELLVVDYGCDWDWWGYLERLRIWND
jgi:hypothetical protein